MWDAWYIIHGISKLGYCLSYKFIAQGGCISTSQNFVKAYRLCLQTIQAQAILMTIINKNCKKMPNEFKIFGHKWVDNLKVILSAMNWDHMLEQVDYIRIAYPFL